jgi:hypothetical protein
MPSIAGFGKAVSVDAAEVIGPPEILAPGYPSSSVG